MDYIDYRGVIPERDAELREYFHKIDQNFYSSAYHAHEPGRPLFSKLIDYDVLNGKTVLEIGCGLGAIAAQFARHGAKVIALDLTPTAVKMTKERFRLFNLKGDFLEGDAENLPLKDASVDFIWSWGVIHHSPDTKQAVNEMYRVLKIGGRACVMIYHKNSLYNYLNVALRYGILRLGYLRANHQELLNKYSDGKELGGCPIAQYFSKKEAQTMFRAFTHVETKVIGTKEAIVNIVPKGFLKGKGREYFKKIIPHQLMNFILAKYGVHLYIEVVK